MENQREPAKPGPRGKWLLDGGTLSEDSHTEVDAAEN